MEYITEVFKLEKKFPFAIFRGKGFSADAVKNGKTYMHNHYCLEINLALSSGGTYYIGDNTYPRAVERIVLPYGIFSNSDTGFITTHGAMYPFCLLFHKHSDINFSSIGLSCLALRIGKSWFAPCNIIV